MLSSPFKQANVANQQVVANGQTENLEKLVASNERGSPAKAIPPHAKGVEFATTISPATSAVAAEHWTQDDGGQGPSKQERLKAR
jgi:hypothetical protein